MAYTYHVFLLCGSIGLFLFGIDYMGESLKRAAGDNIRNILQKFTKNSGSAFLVGALMTAFIQSSGATMVMTMGFVGAQLMALSQSLYVMLGASIGTTITAQIIAFDIAPFAPLILFVGLVMSKFINNKLSKKIGDIILGFGMLFMGIYLMSSAIESLQLGNLVMDFLSTFSNPVLSFLFGIVLTLIIQSSSASVGILQSVLASTFGAAFSLNSVIYMIIGMNVGAVAPLVISSIGANKASRRATVAEIMAKLVAAAGFIILICIFPALIRFIASLSPDSISRQVANLHLFFNLIGAVLVFPLIKPIERLAMKIMPDDVSDEFYAQKLIYVNNNMNKSPSVVLPQAHKEVMRFADICVENFKLSIDSFSSLNDEKCDKILITENTINFLNHELHVFLISLYKYKLSEDDHTEIGGMLEAISNFERIADHAENIAEYVRILNSSKATLSEEAWKDISKMCEETVGMIELSIKIFDTKDSTLLGQAYENEERVDRLQDELIDNHIERLSRQMCDPQGAVIYTDLVSDLERCSDHALNIAETILGNNTPIE